MFMKNHVSKIRIFVFLLEYFGFGIYIEKTNIGVFQEKYQTNKKLLIY